MSHTNLDNNEDNKNDIDHLITQKLQEQRSLETLLRVQFAEHKKSIDDSLKLYGSIIMIALTILGIIGYSEVKKLIGTQIEAKLITPEVNKTVREALDVQTKSFVAEKINPLNERIISQQNHLDNLNTTSKEISTKIKDVDSKINAIKYQNDFALVFSNAQANDAAAFNQLLTWRNDKSSLYHYKAISAAEKIMQDHQSPFEMDPMDIQQSGKDKLSKLKMPELLNIYNSIDTTNLEYSRSKPRFIKYVWHRQDINTKEKMQFLVDIMKQEKDLVTLEYIGQCFREISKQNVYNIATDDLIGWWNEHKDEIK